MYITSDLQVQDYHRLPSLIQDWQDSNSKVMNWVIHLALKHDILQVMNLWASTQITSIAQNFLISFPMYERLTLTVQHTTNPAPSRIHSSNRRVKKQIHSAIHTRRSWRTHRRMVSIYIPLSPRIKGLCQIPCRWDHIRQRLPHP